MIPQHIKDSIDAWALNAHIPGSFTKSVLENDLRKAVLGADPESLANLKNIVLYVVNEIPAPCWGSPEKMEKWVIKGGQKGMHEARQRHEALILGEDG